VVLFLFDAHLYASNARLLKELQSRARALAVVLMRDPYDADMLAPGVLGVTAYGFRKCQLDAVIARLVHGGAGLTHCPPRSSRSTGARRRPSGRCAGRPSAAAGTSSRRRVP